jgi:hypothetical protein
MTRHLAAHGRLAILALGAAVAGPIAYAHAHESTEPTVNGKGPLGLTYAGGGSFDLPGVSLDCPPPEGGPVCHIAAAVTSRTPLRLRKGGPLKIRTIGKVKYILGANGDMQDIRPPVLTPAGATVLKRYGTVPAYAHVTNVLNAQHKASRWFRLTVKPGYRPGT